MTLGIKVGPQKQSFNDLELTQAPFCEVWYNICKKDDYTDLFEIVKRRNMEVGLHFWGHLDDQTWTNIAYPDSRVISESMALMKETIDIAATHHFQYVNIHPSNYALSKIDFEKQSFELLTPPAPDSVCEQTFFEHLTALNTHAHNRGVVLLIETVPHLDTNGWRGTSPRLRPINLYAPDNSLIVKASTMGFTIANDFGHTSCTVQSDNRSIIWQHLNRMTHQLFNQTRLLHLAYIIPPYNGTDYHSHLDADQFDSELAVPNKQELIQLLHLFKDRSDVWALVEPDGRHVENYFYAKKLLELVV